MERNASSSVVWAVVLILLGVVALILQMAPNWQDRLELGQSWPLVVIGIGVVLLVIGTVAARPGLAIPACIVAGIGGLLAWQVYTAYWESWAYVWALIPGFIGVGMLVARVLGDEDAQRTRSGVRLIVVSTILFAVCTSFFSMVGLVGPYWPVLLIGVGVLLLVWSGMALWRPYASPRGAEPPSRRRRADRTPRGGAQAIGPIERRNI